MTKENILGNLRPIGEAQPIELSFIATISDDFVKEFIDKEGVEPPSEWVVEFELSEISSSSLRHRLRVAWERYQAVEPYPELPRLEGDPAKFLEIIEPWLDAIEEEEAQADQQNARELEEERVRTELFTAELKSWVAAHGSKRLKMAADRGYRTNTSYALERAEKEMPGFWVDTAKDCEWGERADPSEEALDIEQAVQRHLNEINSDLEARIVWLTETPRALDSMMEEEGFEFSPQEALIVPGYLGRYLLVMPIDSRFRRPGGMD